MYPEYNKIKEFMSQPCDLLKSSMKMEDIFNYSTITNAKERAVMYINDKGKLKHYRYSKLRKHAFQFASVLAQYLTQQKKHQPIVLKLSNCPRWTEIFWAILMVGYKPLLIDAKTSKEGTQNLIDQSHATAIITDDKNDYSVQKISVCDLVTGTHQYNFALEWEDEVIFCSSGTTGDVKLMIYNGNNLCHQIASSINMPEETKDIMYPKKYGKIRILAMVPFHHIFGFVAVFLWYSFYGKTIVYPKSIASGDIQDICINGKVTHVFSVPLFWDSLAQSFERKALLESASKQEILDKMIGYYTGKLSKEDAGKAASKIVKDKVQNGILGNKIRYCISGGGYLSSKTCTTINGIGYPLYNGFGMTELGVTSVELSPIVTQRLKGSIGKPLYGVEYKIKSKNKNKDYGELFVKAKSIHIREIIAGEEKETCFDEEGFFPTGDIVEKDAAGYYFIKGRIKDIIINADGENVFPDELELYFKELPHVKNLCVLGIDIKHSTNQEIDLVLELDNSIKEEEFIEIHKHIQEIGKNLPKGTKITKIYLSINKLPVANNMKVKRYVIKKAIESHSKDFVVFGAKKETKKFEGFDEKTIQAIIEPVRRLFSEVLILPLYKIDDNAHWINDLGGDSMNYVELCLKINDKFKITIPEEHYGQMTCINDFVEEIAKLQKKTR